MYRKLNIVEWESALGQRYLRDVPSLPFVVVYGRNAVFAVDARLPLGRVTLGAYAQGVVFAYDNGHGYHPGNRYAAGLSGDVEVLTPKLRVGASGDFLTEQPERWGGVVQQDGNVGRTDILAGGSVSYAFGKVVASLSVKVPV